mgnify:CR=1 FL=1
MNRILRIQAIGVGCAACKHMEADVRAVVARLGLDAMVGLMGLGAVLEQLLAMGRTPDRVTNDELLGTVRARKT